MAELTVLDTSLKAVLILEDYYSLVWTERYDEEGDFELELPATFSTNKYIVPGNYLVMEESEYVMIIEDVNPKVSEDQGTVLVVKGYSCESILKWRVTQKYIYINGLVRTGITTLINSNFISPTNTKRILPQFAVFTNPDISHSVQNVYEPATIYDIIKDICEIKNLGFKVTLSGPNSSRVLTFSLTEGKDRSHLQTTNPRVIFSEDYDNVISSSYYLATADYKNVVLVVTDDDNPTLQFVNVYDGSEPSGLARRETTINEIVPRDIPDEDPLTDGEVLNVITHKGLEHLYSLRPVGIFDGEFDTQSSFVYGVDFFMGDLVQCVINEENVRARVIEYIRSFNTEGVTYYVSFDFDV